MRTKSVKWSKNRVEIDSFINITSILITKDGARSEQGASSPQEHPPEYGIAISYNIIDENDKVLSKGQYCTELKDGKIGSIDDYLDIVSNIILNSKGIK
jgi:hypothetical protein